MAASITSALLLFFRAQGLKQKLSTALKVKKHHQENAKKPPYLDRYLAVDTLIAQKKYREAWLNYEKILADMPKNLKLTRSIQLRMRNLVELEKMKGVLFSHETHDSLQDMSLKVRQTDSLAKQVTSNEQQNSNQLDSLRFALEKASVFAQNLRTQLKDKLSSDYVTFTNKKGTKVYYVGSVKAKKANGQGVGLYSNGKRYEGNWKDNLHHGYGILYWPDGEYYDGDFQSGQRNGKGSYHWPSGDKFVGEWKNDKRNGPGIFYKKNGKIVAKGIWKDNKFIKK
ncbi:putative phosphatidylinositol-4-phosphate 5-kinase [Microscilla marina ATCC 23134]|uniref:Putative phosphatidylinositol-4-phosphate 5-kinase n=1 Tax=Microscilla marina ATCC 23134 TaxID=313606 RepID=A1ZWD0_MICM2|nr:putative phosphatidylinositol-4-phosphate 5-kinase [Microscilla marina ATCC 23134]